MVIFLGCVFFVIVWVVWRVFLLWFVFGSWVFCLLGLGVGICGFCSCCRLLCCWDWRVLVLLVVLVWNLFLVLLVCFFYGCVEFYVLCVVVGWFWLDILVCSGFGSFVFWWCFGRCWRGVVFGCVGFLRSGLVLGCVIWWCDMFVILFLGLFFCFGCFVGVYEDGCFGWFGNSCYFSVVYCKWC